MQTPDGTIRPFDEAGTDYDEIVRVLRAVDPDAGIDAATFRAQDRQWDHDKFEAHRWVAVDRSGTMVGAIDVRHHPRQFEPWRYLVTAFVDPKYRRRGWGTALLNHAESFIRARGARELRAEARDDGPSALAFARHHAFREVHRSWHGRLTLATFDRARFGTAAAQAIAAGIEIVTLAAETAKDRNALERVWRLAMAIESDVPRVTPVTLPDFQTWVRTSIEWPGLIPEGYFLAQRGGEYVGLTFLRRPADHPGVLNQGLTGVATSARGQGVGLALKLAAIEFAIAEGAREVRTWNSERNLAILRLNDALGFVRQTASVDLQKTLVPDGP